MIKIDMEMPERCLDCKFNHGIIEGRKVIDVCFFTGNETGDVVGRTKDCKLIDSDKRTCDTCKHLKERKEYRMCEEYECDFHSKWQAK
jgi:hypothetical protein